MRILYGVCGDGFGHSSRALIVADYLKKKGHDVKIITYGRAYKVLKDKFDVFKVSGLQMIFVRGVLKKRKTMKYNLENFPKNLKKWKRFHKLMNEFKPDLCISDMDPIVPMLRNWYNLPLISFDNQHRITNLKFDVPKKYYKDYLLAKNVVNAFVRKADYFVIVSFTQIKNIKKNTFVVPPIIRENIKKIKPKFDGKILVYLTRKNSSVLRILKTIDENFVVYGYNIKKKDKNLEFKKRETFLKDLSKCKAIIATSGFTLMAESLYLKKPYFALPLKGQFEQTLNALFLKKSGFGDYAEDITKKDVDNFLDNLDNYRKKLKRYAPNYNKLFDVLDRILLNLRKF